MTDTNQNFSLRAGTTSTVQMTISDEGSPLNLSGFTVKWATSRQLSSSCFGEVALIEKCSNDATLTIIDAVNGVVEFTLDPADTVDLTQANYEHQLTTIDAFDNEEVVTEGTMTIKKRIVNTC